MVATTKKEAQFAVRLKEIEERLNNTHAGPWKAVSGGSKVFCPDISTPDEPYYSRAEDDCILDANGVEVLGVSEWIRVEWEDLEFMAEARSDVEFLLTELKKRLEK